MGAKKKETHIELLQKETHTDLLPVMLVFANLWLLISEAITIVVIYYLFGVILAIIAMVVTAISIILIKLNRY
ncbi:MAG: hypothetical protein ACYCS1_05155 [Gammaproteobacteria bacterium]